MWSRPSRQLVGFVLFVVAGWFLSRAALGWTPVWQKQLVLPAKHNPTPLIDPMLAADPSIEAAQVKVIGPLANVVQPDDSASTATENVVRPTAPAVFDHVEKPTTSAAVRLHNTFVVKTYRFFSFQVPAHTTSPKLHGTFKSSLADRSRRAGSVDASLLDQEQFDQFVRGSLGNVVFTDSSSAAGIIDIVLDSTLFDPKKYYLVFRTPDNRSRVVTADVILALE
jgi:hypothetical protein